MTMISTGRIAVVKFQPNGRFGSTTCTVHSNELELVKALLNNGSLGSFNESTVTSWGDKDHLQALAEVSAWITEVREAILTMKEHR